MAPEIVDVTYEGDFRLRLAFADKLVAIVDFVPYIKDRGGLCAALQTSEYFRQARIDRDLHTITWPNGYDIDPDVLYSWASGKPVTQPTRAADAARHR
jgi:hypothetical protein